MVGYLIDRNSQHLLAFFFFFFFVNEQDSPGYGELTFHRLFCTSYLDGTDDKGASRRRISEQKLLKNRDVRHLRRFGNLASCSRRNVCDVTVHDAHVDIQTPRRMCKCRSTCLKALRCALIRHRVNEAGGSWLSAGTKRVPGRESSERKVVVRDSRGIGPLGVAGGIFRAAPISRITKTSLKLLKVPFFFFLSSMKMCHAITLAGVYSSRRESSESYFTSSPTYFRSVRFTLSRRNFGQRQFQTSVEVHNSQFTPSRPI